MRDAKIFKEAFMSWGMAEGNAVGEYSEWNAKFSEWFDSEVPKYITLNLFLKNKEKSLEEITDMVEKEISDAKIRIEMLRWKNLGFREKLDETAFYLVPIYDFFSGIYNKCAKIYKKHFEIYPTKT